MNQIRSAMFCVAWAGCGAVAPTEDSAPDTRDIQGVQASVSAFTPSAKETPSDTDADIDSAGVITEMDSEALGMAADETDPSPAAEISPETVDTTGPRAVGAWLRAHGIDPNSAGICDGKSGGCDCFEIVSIANSGREALRCSQWSVTGEWSLVTEQALMVSKGRKLMSVWKRAVVARALDPVSPKEKPWIELTVQLSPDGRSVSVTEPFPHACNAALQKARQGSDASFQDDDSASRIQSNFNEELHAIQQVCRSIGTYVWKGGSFRRK